MKLHTSQFIVRLYTSQFIIHSSLLRLHSSDITLQTSHFTVQSSDFNKIPYFTINSQTWHVTVHTSQFIVRLQTSQFQLHFEVWTVKSEVRLRPTLWIWKGAIFSRGTIWISIASWQSSTPSTPVEKEVVNWRVQVFANSTVNLHFHRKNLAIFQCTLCKNAQKLVLRLWWIHSLIITMTVWLKSFKFFGKVLLDIVLQYEAILDSLE